MMGRAAGCNERFINDFDHHYFVPDKSIGTPFESSTKSSQLDCFGLKRAIREEAVCFVFLHVHHDTSSSIDPS